MCEIRHCIKHLRCVERLVFHTCVRCRKAKRQSTKFFRQRRKILKASSIYIPVYSAMTKKEYQSFVTLFFFAVKRLSTLFLYCFLNFRIPTSFQKRLFYASFSSNEMRFLIIFDVIFFSVRRLPTLSLYFFFSFYVHFFFQKLLFRTSFVMSANI